jgi:hypothetical protein
LPARTRRFLDYLKRWAKTPPDWAKPASKKQLARMGQL